LALTPLRTNSYDTLAELHTPKITVNTDNIQFSQSSLAVAWYRLPTADIPLPLDSRTVPGLSYSLLTCLQSSESELLHGWRFTPNQFVLAPSPLRPTTCSFLSTGHLRLWSLCNIISDVRMGLSLQLLLALANSVIAGSESREAHDRILQSQIRDSSILVDQVPMCMPQEQGGSVIPPDIGFHFHRLLRLGGIRTVSTRPSLLLNIASA
jgi:hypothetical protein